MYQVTKNSKERAAKKLAEATAAVGNDLYYDELGYTGLGGIPAGAGDEVQRTGRWALYEYNGDLLLAVYAVGIFTVHRYN